MFSRYLRTLTGEGEDDARSSDELDDESDETDVLRCLLLPAVCFGFLSLLRSKDFGRSFELDLLFWDSLEDLLRVLLFPAIWVDLTSSISGLAESLSISGLIKFFL